MPAVSQAQRRWAFANKDKPGPGGKAAKEFADADPGGKLPEKVKDGKPEKSRSARWYDKQKDK